MSETGARLSVNSQQLAVHINVREVNAVKNRMKHHLFDKAVASITRCFGWNKRWWLESETDYNI